MPVEQPGWNWFRLWSEGLTDYPFCFSFGCLAHFLFLNSVGELFQMMVNQETILFQTEKENRWQIYDIAIVAAVLDEKKLSTSSDWIKLKIH